MMKRHWIPRRDRRGAASPRACSTPCVANSSRSSTRPCSDLVGRSRRLASWRNSVHTSASGPTDRIPALSVLCRSTGQIEAAVAAGVSTIYAEYQDIKLYKEAVEAARKVEGTTIYLATPRIQKPGEANIFRFLARQGADGLLVRNAGGSLFGVRA